MTPSKRVIINTMATYGRSIIAVVLMVFSNRWVLNALGQIDFGLFSVVGSIIIFITILNTVMGTSAARHYAYAIGRGNKDELNKWFNTAIGIHIVLASLLTIIGYLLGEYLIKHLLNVPADRISACLWVFNLSLVSVFVSMISMPFVAMFVARQHMVELAVWFIFQSFLSFSLALFLRYFEGDKLIIYSAGMVLIIIFIQTVQIARAFIVFVDCSIKLSYWHDLTRIKEVFSFAGWNLFGALGGTIRDHGSAVLLNVHFGPKVNAAYDIAYQASRAANLLSNAMLNALAPEMTSMEGRGDRKRMICLAQLANKYGAILITLVAIPLIAEMDYVLKIWLNEPPVYSAVLCQLILVSVVFDRLSAGNMLAVSAYGKIAGYQATLGTCLILTVPLAWVGLWFDAPPASVGCAFIFTVGAVSVGRVLWMRRLLGVSVLQWLRQVFLPCGIVAFVSTIAVLIPRLWLSPSCVRLIITGLSGVLFAILTSLIFAFDHRERAYAYQASRRILNIFKHS